MDTNFASLDVQEMKNKVEEFLEGFGEMPFPRPLIAVAAFKDFSVRIFTPTEEEKNFNVSGYIDYEKHLILVNEFDSKQRQNFTAGHELGHLALHRADGNKIDYREQIVYDGGYGVYDPKEVEANAFAAELLMPLEEFIKQLKTKSSPYELSLHFGVSVLAINARKDKLKRSKLI